MRKLSLSILSTALFLTASMTTQAAGVEFSKNLSNYNFSTANVENGYKGDFVYNGKTYGESQNTALNLNTLPTGFTRIASEATPTPNAVYRFYKQAHSVVIGNIVRGDSGRLFVKAVVGDATLANTLPAQASYNYTGTVFNHIDGTEGKLNYTVNVNGAAVTGSGSISGVTGNRPTVTGGPFEISGTLGTVNFANVDGKLAAAKGGDTNLTLTRTEGAAIPLTGAKYDIGVYGPNAAEVAGAIHGGTLDALVGGYGIAGTKNP